MSVVPLLSGLSYTVFTFGIRSQHVLLSNRLGSHGATPQISDLFRKGESEYINIVLNYNYKMFATLWFLDVCLKFVFVGEEYVRSILVLTGCIRMNLFLFTDRYRARKCCSNPTANVGTNRSRSLFRNIHERRDTFGG